MILLYIGIFLMLVLFSAFFSSAETALLSLNKIKLNLKAKKKEKKAVMLAKILENPEEFFSTILIGNNFVNIAAASISTVVFTRFITGNEEMSLLVSTVVTTLIILLFSEVLPKSYAFRYNEKLANIYAYPIQFFSVLFYPLVKAVGFISNLLFNADRHPTEGKHLSVDEIKHFLSTQQTLLSYNPDSIRMVNEIIDIAEKDIKSIMTPRLNLVAIDENASIDELRTIILEKQISKVPVYREKLDHIVGIINARDILQNLWDKDAGQLEIKELMREPILLSEFSSLNYALKQFKKNRLNMAVIIDEYGATIGALTLYDIFSEILGELEISSSPIRKIRDNTYQFQGNITVDEVNHHLHLSLPERVDYSTMSGLFVYHYGKFPTQKSRLRIGDVLLIVQRMGKRKIEELIIVLNLP